MFKPVEVTPLPGYRLRLRYADGVEQAIEYAAWLTQEQIVIA